MRNLTEFSKRFFAALAIVALASSMSMAQQRGGAPVQTGQSVKGADIKGRAPVSREILKVKLPKAEEATLSNGLRVVLLESHRVPTFTMQMVVMSGGLSDPPNHHGLASFTATLLREGTQTRSSKEIAEQVDRHADRRRFSRRRPRRRFIERRTRLAAPPVHAGRVPKTCAVERQHRLENLGSHGRRRRMVEVDGVSHRHQI